MDPKVYLAIDNCYASKRWIRPAEWLKNIRSLGLRYIEASADTECDPMYMGEAFTRDWIEEVRRECEAQDMCVKNVYSGHGTYATSGLTHYDERVIVRFRDGWMKKQIDTANALGAGFGFFAHGFEELLLQDDALYSEKLEQLYDTLADIAAYAAQTGMNYVGVEQMYSPHQPPWTIDGAEKLMREVYRRGGAPFYITEDLGHMNGQQFFAMPDADALRDKIEAGRRGVRARRFWVGTEKAHAIYQRAIAGEIDAGAAVGAILEDAQAHPHIFSRPEDWSIDAWVRRLGCYSPIVHLQQSDGKSSPHWPFSAEFNAKGVVRAEEVLRALVAAYAQEDDPTMPPKCGEVVLTLEPFISTAGNTFDLMDDLRESVAYWRKWIPRDGMYLSEIRRNLEQQ